MTGTRYQRQHGSALIAVMVAMMLLMLLGSTLVNHFAVTEAQAVEDNLAEIRSYWAMMGHMNYMLSRASARGLCNATDYQVDSDPNALITNANAYCDGNDFFASSGDTIDLIRSGLGLSTTSRSRVGAMQRYLAGTNELQSGSVEDLTNSFMRWRYPTGTNPSLPISQADSNYIDIRGFVRPRDATNLQPTGNQNINSDLLMSLDLEVVSTDTNIPPLRNLGERVRRLTIGFCATDAAAGVDSNGNPITVVAPGCGIAEGQSLINFVRREALVTR